MRKAKSDVPVTVTEKESIPEVTRDSSPWKKIGSSAVIEMTVKAFLYWVGRKMISIFLEVDDN
ncbi:hypothetical protein KSS93_25290 [Pseudomonas xanthosomatis]|uniref:hypothetical protein n=1 Tax=Pseudomonas xanthosomatis TaxID=2842356 RepID=UPI001C3CF186|nr:hypothetical protein [Pseudomonas xanthosomatis]QXH46141.1 hypothetical protein KSS93_25290 [Pseudomonas xanthosomatis]